MFISIWSCSGMCSIVSGLVIVCVQYYLVCAGLCSAVLSRLDCVQYHLSIKTTIEVPDYAIRPAIILNISIGQPIHYNCYTRRA